MNWSEFQAALERNDLTQAEFSRLTGYTENVISKWRHRVKGCPKWVKTWLQLYRRGRGKHVALPPTMP